MAGIFGVVGFAFYFGVSVWGIVWLVKSGPADPGMLFLQALAASLVAVCVLAIMASIRLLKRPNLKDLRSVVSFNFLAIWMLLADQMLHTGARIEFRLVMVCVLFAGLTFLSTVWLKHVERSQSGTAKE